MFVASPDRYLVPDYKISPFLTGDISRNRHLPDDRSSDDYFRDRHPDVELCYTQNGREALALALADIRLKRDDVVTIMTTTQNRYISSCVTGEVEKVCLWNRTPDSRTRAILVIHEFGMVFRGLDKWKSWGVPIIEDCAYSFFSGDDSGFTGRTGDYVIYSFPKMFPLQEGGLLATKVPLTTRKSIISDTARQYYRNVLSHHLRNEAQIVTQRRSNYTYLSEELAQRGFPARFVLADAEVPGVFMFRGNNLDLDRLKEHVTHHGIQCSVFYGENCFFLPVHQALVKDDLDYFIFVIDQFIQKAP